MQDEQDGEEDEDGGRRRCKEKKKKIQKEEEEKKVQNKRIRWGDVLTHYAICLCSGVDAGRKCGTSTTRKQIKTIEMKRPKVAK